MSITPTISQAEEIDAIAKARGISKNALVLEAISALLAKEHTDVGSKDPRKTA